MTAEVPDASDWTIEDTVAFFKGVGFIEQCEVFREQVRGKLEKTKNKNNFNKIQNK